MVKYKKKNPFGLNGKTILVTGASSGIGRETAIQCSYLGANVVITSRSKERLTECFNLLKGNSNTMIVADITNQEDVDRLVAEIPEIDGVVLCAGRRMAVPFLLSTKEKYDEVFSVNYFAPVELLRLLVLYRKLKQDGSAVFVSSVGGTLSFQAGNMIYGASKAAVNSTMRYCARELAPKKIRVNCVTPAKVNTKPIIGSSLSEEQRKADLENYPLKRYGEPEDIAYGIIYLLSDASSWVTGQSLVIDGGKTLN